jgi:hypothetical protein
MIKYLQSVIHAVTSFLVGISLIKLMPPAIITSTHPHGTDVLQATSDLNDTQNENIGAELTL